MARTKEFKLPKYLRLAKGLMWMDVDGDNASGIRLYRNMEQLVGRGNDLKTMELRTDKPRAYPEYVPEVENPNKRFPPKKDKHDNRNSEHGMYGAVDMDDKSWFCTDDVPPAKLGKILTAYQNGILVKHDPKKEYKELPRQQKRKNFVIKQDGDIVFNGTNKVIYNMLNNQSIQKIQRYIKDAGASNKQDLMDMYQYEIKGFNNLARPRSDVLEPLRKKLNELGPGLSPVTKNDLDDEE